MQGCKTIIKWFMRNESRCLCRAISERLATTFVQTVSDCFADLSRGERGHDGILIMRNLMIFTTRSTYQTFSTKFLELPVEGTLDLPDPLSPFAPPSHCHAPNGGRRDIYALRSGRRCRSG